MNRFMELSEKDCTHFISLPGEEILLVKRQHPFVLFIPILSILLLWGLIFAIGNYIVSLALPPITTRLAFILLTLLVLFLYVLKVIVDWYYHLYVITNRKILEISCIPFFSDQIDNVFLDQVRTTEIDTHIGTFVHELLDMGDITIAFDRPSHAEVFILRNIRSPRDSAIFLGKELEEEMSHSPVWFGPKEIPSLVKTAEDIYAGAIN